MRARFNIAQIEPGKIEDATRLFKETVAPAISSAPGNHGLVVAIDDTNNMAIAIALWESDSDMEAFPGPISANPSLAAGILNAPEREFYDVSITDRLESVGVATRVRINRRKIQAGKLDEAIRLFNDSIIPTVKERKGNLGSFLLTDSASSELIAVAFWASDGEMMAEEPPGDIAHISNGPARRYHCDVIWATLD